MCKIKKLFSFIFAICLVLSLSGCGSASKKFEKEFKTGNYRAAIETYYDGVLGNSKEEYICRQLLEEYTEKSWNEYVAGNKSGADMEIVIHTAKEINAEFQIIPDINMYISSFEKIEASKESYNAAIAYMETGDYRNAVLNFQNVLKTDLQFYEESQIRLDDAISAYRSQTIGTARGFAEQKDYAKALQTIAEAKKVIGDSDVFNSIIADVIKQMSNNSRKTISNDCGVTADGYVVYGWEDTPFEQYIFNDIVSISNNGPLTVGLRSNGTIVTSYSQGWYGQDEAETWKNIVAVEQVQNCIVGLKADGTVLAAGDDAEWLFAGQQWTDIVAISSGGYHIVGLRADGTVVATGENNLGQCDVYGWRDIVKVSAGAYYTTGLRADGTVLAIGDDGWDQCEVQNWRDIIDVSAGVFHTVGLKSDGTVVAVGEYIDGQLDVYSWRDIVSVYAGANYTLGLKADGSVVMTNGRLKDSYGDIFTTKMMIP